jgi:4'-phosphopantetheinyl transferase
MILYYMDVSELDYNNMSCTVSEERMDKSNKFIHQKDKNLCIGVEILLNHALNMMGILDPVFDRDKYGKPYLKNYQDVHFNLSHSENYVACAVSDSPVGVDIEYIHDVDLDIAKNYFYDQEYEYVINSPNIDAFFKLWVLKESYMKMTGLGFRLGLDEFSIEIDDEISLIHNNNTCNLGFWNVCDGNYMLGVCSEKKSSEPVLINLDEI